MRPGLLTGLPFSWLAYVKRTMKQLDARVIVTQKNDSSCVEPCQTLMQKHREPVIVQDVISIKRIGNVNVRGPCRMDRAPDPNRFKDDAYKHLENQNV